MDHVTMQWKRTRTPWREEWAAKLWLTACKGHFLVGERSEGGWSASFRESFEPWILGIFPSAEAAKAACEKYAVEREEAGRYRSRHLNVLGGQKKASAD